MPIQNLRNVQVCRDFRPSSPHTAIKEPNEHYQSDFRSVDEPEVTGGGGESAREEVGGCQESVLLGGDARAARIAIE